MLRWSSYKGTKSSPGMARREDFWSTIWSSVSICPSGAQVVPGSRCAWCTVGSRNHITHQAVEREKGPGFVKRHDLHVEQPVPHRKAEMVQCFGVVRECVEKVAPDDAVLQARGGSHRTGVDDPPDNGPGARQIASTMRRAAEYHTRDRRQ